MSLAVSDRPDGQPGAVQEDRHSPVRAYLRSQLAAMHPAYFALAMATGIVAIASHLFGLREFAVGLAWINLFAFPILCVLFIARFAVFPERVVADLKDHGRAPGYFTIVAATGVMGAQTALLHDQIFVAQIFWWACVVLWAACTYTVFAVLTVSEHKPSLEKGINGGWLVAVVATQSVCVLGCTLGGAVLVDREAALFALMAFWLGGGMLYLWIIGLIFYRYMFFSFSPEDLMPPYWINMGAVAISTLAGALLAGQAETSALLGPMRPFILGLTVMFWATATWWIPMLIILGIWRHIVKRFPLRYDPLYWGAVFPLGMYSVGTARMVEAMDLPFLSVVPPAFFYIASGAWTLALIGLLHRLITGGAEGTRAQA